MNKNKLYAKCKLYICLYCMIFSSCVLAKILPESTTETIRAIDLEKINQSPLRNVYKLDINPAFEANFIWRDTDGTKIRESKDRNEITVQSSVGTVYQLNRSNHDDLSKNTNFNSNYKENRLPTVSLIKF